MVMPRDLHPFTWAASEGARAGPTGAAGCYTVLRDEHRFGSVAESEVNVGQTPKRRAPGYIENGPRRPNIAQMTSTATARKTSCGNPIDAITIHARRALKKPGSFGRRTDLPRTS